MNGFRIKDIDGYECVLLPWTLITVEVERKGDSLEYSYYCVARPADIYGNKAILMCSPHVNKLLDYADDVRKQMEDYFSEIPFAPTSFAELLN